MKHKVCYGSYSLGYWVKLMLNGSLTLPGYQRGYVWKVGQAKNLISAMKVGQFIPPVIIGSWRKGGNTYNYIIDGQQRLTTILLAAIGRFPKDSAYQYDPGEDCPKRYVLPDLSKIGRYIDDIRRDTNFINQTDEFVDFLTERDLDSIRLGYSFIVPDSAESIDDVRKFYVHTFNNINSQGTALKPYESRRSLYFLDESFLPLFDSDCLNQYKIKTVPADFLRYIAILSEFHKNNNYKTIAESFGAKEKKEAYYSKYILDTIGGDDSRFRLPNIFLHNGDITGSINILKQNLVTLKIPQKYESVIELDLFLFGLIYYSMSLGKVFREENADKVRSLVNKQISIVDKDPRHKKEPNAWKFVRDRLNRSLRAYKQLFDDEPA